MDPPNPPPKPGPLTHQPWFYQDWQCNVCYEAYEKTRLLTTWTTKDNFMVCQFCITPIFRKILEYDFNYPARWGGEELHIGDFDDVLPPGFGVWYKQRGAEITAKRKAALVESPEGLTRGVDYQVCPRCKSCNGLEDGCNHVSCLYGGSICFVCGEVVMDDGSEHWDVGGCPRYNAKGSGREQYDDVVRRNENDIWSDEDREDGDGDEEDGSEEDVSESDGSEGDGSEEDDSDDEFRMDVDEIMIQEAILGSFNDNNSGNDHNPATTPNDKAQMRDIALALGFASHDFNMAMQLSDAQTEAKLMRLFATPSPDLTIVERNDIFAVMDSFVPMEEWHKHEGRPVHIHELLLDHILTTPAVPRGGQHDFLFHVDY
jgi:hypothetical protein